MASTSNEHQLQLVYQTFEKDFQFNIHEVIRLYNIFCMILFNRINGRLAYIDTIANLQKLTVLKEKVIVRKILNLDSRRFLSQMRDIENIANRLLIIYDATYIGLH